jgi:hypothetical protein
LAARLFDFWLLAFASALILGAFGGIAYHLWIEVPLLKLLRPRSHAPFQRDAHEFQERSKEHSDQPELGR